MHLVASTTGTDSDWIVKLIDVQPDRIAPPVHMSGYQLPIATDIFQGRYRTSFEHPEAIKPNEPLTYIFALPMVNHTFQPGHRIMVQVQSTLFPLYDRNPQRFVPKHLRNKTRRFPESNTANLAPTWPRKLHQPCRSSRGVTLSLWLTLKQSR